jgi:hypothetical protein
MLAGSGIMPKGVYLRTEKTRKIMSEALKGRTFSEEHRRKMSDAHKGKVASEATRKKISDVQKGKRLSEEHKRKIGIASTGRKQSEETLQKKRDARKGFRHTVESRKKISDVQKGRHHSEEHRRKNSEGHKGLIRSVEHRHNLSTANTGKKMSEESKIKMSVAQKGKRCGKNHPNWKGGTSFEPYCIKFNKEFKERVRAFFGYQCQECGHVWHEGEKRLAVHHVNFRKDSCCAEDAIPLFVSLCPNTCHSKTNFNRSFWEYWFTEMITRNYGGKCYFTKEELIQQSSHSNTFLTKVGCISR